MICLVLYCSYLITFIKKTKTKKIMENKILKAFIVLVFLTAVFISVGSVKELSGEAKETVKQETAVKSSNATISGKSLVNSNAGIYSLKLATASYAQFY